jgi:chemotaxis response regulator CheB
MNSIRVLVANQPRLIRELIVATISDQPDIEVVGEIQQETELQTAVETTRPDFLIVALERSNQLPNFCESILRNHPAMRVIAIAAGRESSMFYWASLNIESNEIETSEAGVLSAFRGKLLPLDKVQ